MLREIATHLLAAQSASLRRRILWACLFLVVMNVVAWATALTMFHACPAVLSLCFVAYGFGLRHAVDADHIAAIDNVTRKLMQQNQKPVCVGLFFSLGHSTIVMLMSLLVVQGTAYAQKHFPDFQRVGGLVGTSISAFFLLLIAAINFFIFLDVFRRFQAARKGRLTEEDALRDMLDGQGRIARTVRMLFSLVGKSWHMYFIGLLFGLGFDTATEVALLGISATQAARQMPIWSIMIFPLLFASGMCLVDTIDGMVMLGAYGWAFVRPIRKLFYNMSITLVSFLIALGIGSLEVLSILASKFEWNTGVWASVRKLSEHSETMGYGIIGLMIACWLASVLVYKLSGFDHLDEPTASAIVTPTDA